MIERIQILYLKSFYPGTHPFVSDCQYFLRPPQRFYLWFSVNSLHKTYDTLKTLFGQRPLQGTKSCRMGRNSVCTSIRPSPPSPPGPPGRPSGPAGRPSGPAGRPSGPSDRPSSPSSRPPSPSGRPSDCSDRPSGPSEKPSDPFG